jgi:hypothetical protein
MFPQEKYRRIVEAYQIEMNTAALEAYQGTIGDKTDFSMGVCR